MATLADQAMERLEPLIDAYGDPDGVLRNLLVALLTPMQLVFDVAQGTTDRDAWATRRDPDECPVEYLPWLAQHVGVRLLPGDSEEVRRDKVREAAGFYRGTVTAWMNHVRRTLTGTQTIIPTEKPGGDRWAFSAGISGIEMPDSTATMAALMDPTQKPAGILPTIDDTVGKPRIDDGSRTVNAATETIDNATLPGVT
jgi:hypothetical protein